MISELLIKTDGSTKLASEGLERKIDELISSMTSLSTSMRGFGAAAKESAAGDRHSRFIERASSTTSKINAQASLAEKQTDLSKSKEYISLNNLQKQRASLEAAQERSKQTEMNAPHRLASSKARYQSAANKASLIRIGEAQLAGGDAELGARLLEGASGGGGRKSSTDKLITAAAMVGTSALISRGITSYVTSTQQLGLASITNPMTSGYNFGSIAENLTNLKAQRNAGLASTAAELLGGGIGAIFGGAKGAFVGTALASSVAAPLSAWYTGSQSQEARRQNMQISNRMDIESMRGTNLGAYATQRSAMGGHSLLDAEVPFINAISRATNLFNDNSKAMGTLTKNVVSYAQATQMDMNTAAAVGASAAILSHDSSFSFGKAKQAFASYGVTDYAGTMNNAVSLMQAGFSANQSTLMASSLSGLNPAAQAASMAYYGSAQDEASKAFISNALGGYSEAIHNPLDPRHRTAVAAANKARNSARGNMGSAGNILNTTISSYLYGDDLFKLPLFNNQRDLTAKGIGPTGMQSGAYAAIDKFNNTGNGDLQATLVSLTGNAKSAASSFREAGDNVSYFSTAIQGITRLMTNTLNTSYASFSGVSSQTKK